MRYLVILACVIAGACVRRAPQYVAMSPNGTACAMACDSNYFQCAQLGNELFGIVGVISCVDYKNQCYANCPDLTRIDAEPQFTDHPESPGGARKNCESGCRSMARGEECLASCAGLR